ncbi:hypothetical protein BGZ94_004238 [Podila epigama]|nr:hypothetical protein BGZ94_004238 [Podila epigama]
MALKSALDRGFGADPPSPSLPSLVLEAVAVLACVGSETLAPAATVDAGLNALNVFVFVPAALALGLPRTRGVID